MTNNIDFRHQRDYNFNRLNELLTRLPIRCDDNVYLHSSIVRDPLDALLIGRGIENENFQDRVKPWIDQAIQSSPYLNN